MYCCMCVKNMYRNLYCAWIPPSFCSFMFCCVHYRLPFEIIVFSCGGKMHGDMVVEDVCVHIVRMPVHTSYTCPCTHHTHVRAHIMRMSVHTHACPFTHRTLQRTHTHKHAYKDTFLPAYLHPHAWYKYILIQSKSNLYIIINLNNIFVVDCKLKYNLRLQNNR